MKRPIEPGLLHLFRYFTGVSVIYFAIIWLYALSDAGWAQSMRFQLWGNFIVYLGLFGYLNWSWIEQRLKQLYLPFGLATAAIFPIIGNFAYLMGPDQSDIYTIISRSWIWLPILVVPLVLIAWQYSYKVVLFYTIFTNGLELIVLLAVIEKLTTETISLASVPLIRAFAFGIVGFIVNTLVRTQRKQNHKLLQTNLRLNQYVNTLELLATTRERSRLAAELHDTLAHTLSGLSINLEAIKTIVNPKQTEAQTMLDHSLVITRSGLDETRRVLKALRAGPLEDLGLKKALSNLVETASMRSTTSFTFTCPDELPVLPMDVEQSIYRIVQEGLENIVRHAKAENASVIMKVTTESLELMIQDDGIGFTSGLETLDNRFGLRGLHERASAVGGILKVESKPNNGTIIQFGWERFYD